MLLQQKVPATDCDLVKALIEPKLGTVVSCELEGDDSHTCLLSWEPHIEVQKEETAMREESHPVSSCDARKQQIEGVLGTVISCEEDPEKPGWCILIWEEYPVAEGD